MKTLSLGLSFGAVGFVIAMAACAGDTPGLCDGNACAANGDGGNDGPSSDAPGIDAPPGCDLTKDPSESTACVDDAVGVFVDATNGAEGNAGTKASPVKSIGGALGKLGGKARVYVCEGTYAEHVKITSAVSIYGGFACGAWTYSGATAKVAPTDAGYALDVEKVTGALQIADIRFTAVAGTEAATSSVAVFVNGSPSVTFRRVALAAGKGFDGKTSVQAADGALMSSTPTASSLDGNSGALGGPAQNCTCVGGGSSKGGAGGNVGANGTAGETAQATPTPATATGAPQSSADCALSVNFARNGSDAPDAPTAASALTPGALTESGWAPSGGAKGTNGGTGQGGGGGGGGAAIGVGGGGACGGCGGAGGDPGEGGGASVALMTLDSPVTLLAATLTTGDAGAGGIGGAGGGGITGGTKGARSGAGCDGGNGGNGGNGGAGGGGAGGISVGVLSKGAKPTVDARITTGAKGAPGTGGVDGQKADTLELQ